MNATVVRGGRLVERDEEVAHLDEAVRGSVAGRGSVVVVEGPAGIGKTALLEVARGGGEGAGMAVVSAQGAALEREFGFGVARQLFEPVIRGASGRLRRQLLAGSAGLAAPVVAGKAAAPVDQLAVVHGLYWLTANLAERAPLLVVIDDVHWADSPSLRFLIYLARRLEGMPALIVGAVRTGDPQVDEPLVAEVIASPGVHVLRPEALSVDGVANVVRERQGAEADAEFVAACHGATGGVPFLVHELVGALAIDRVQPTAAAAAQVGAAGPRTVAHATMLRLSRLSPSASAVARATAVLGRHARLDRVGELAGVGEHETRAAVAALIGMEVLVAGPPLQFVHPLVQRAVYDDLPIGQRADAHGRAARLLANEQAQADEIAAHLLLSEPAGRSDVVELLRTAAREALARGAPESAVVYLRRAVDEESAATDRVALLHELGRTEGVIRDPRAIGDLERAIELSDDPVVRARIRADLAEVYLFAGRWPDWVRHSSEALQELGDRDPVLAARLETFGAAVACYDPRLVAEFDAKLEQRRALVERGGAETRSLALLLAGAGAVRAADAAEVVALVERGLDHGGFLRDEGPASPALGQLGALIVVDQLDAMQAVSEEVLAEARRRGSVVGFVCGAAYRGAALAHRGALVPAEADLRAIVELAQQHALAFAMPSILGMYIDPLLERPQLDDVAALAETGELEPALAATYTGALLLSARGRLRLGRGQHDLAVADLRACGEINDALGFRNGGFALWRIPLALALPPDARAEADALVGAELDLAAATGLARRRGVALRVAGLLNGGERGIELLRESLRVLDSLPAALERARTLVELGAALRRANERVAARDQLRLGLELAHRCGAERLAERAVEELHASGARPRRRVISGRDALTPSEQRVARMAAEGLTNREIAQALFVTAKTVENQLGSCYRKLGIHSREQIAPALGGAEIPA